MTRWLTTLTLCLGASALRAQSDPLIDVKAVLAPPLAARTLKTTEKDNIVTEEVLFHSEKDGTKSVDIFAYFSYPKGARKLPAFIWNQGGLAQASTYWTEFGAKRGYAALCIDFPLPGYRSTGGYPIVSGLEIGSDPKKAPIVHGAVALLRAVSYLESRAEVDKDRIGMTGSSWGGFYTTLMAGLDPRLKACSSMFGSGSLQLGNNWWDSQGPNPAKDAAHRELWRTTLDPAWRLAQSKTPIAWTTGTNDIFYWLNAVDKTYTSAAGPKTLSLLPNWDHALNPSLDEQVFAWLDVHLKGAPAFLKVTPVEVVKAGDRLQAKWSFTGPRQATAAELIVSYGEPGNWPGRYWHTIKGTLKDGQCTALLPEATMVCFVSGTVLDKDGFRYSTPLLQVDPAKLGIQSANLLPDYDGCSEWGGFEKEHIQYLTLHGLPVPSVRPQAREGKQSALFNAGKNALPPIYCTAAVAHTFRCYLKASKPADVVVSIGWTPGGKAPGAAMTVAVGTDWTEVRLPCTTPRELVAGARAQLTVPPGVEVQVDAVQFRPAP